MNEQLENLIDEAKKVIAEYDPGESKFVLEKIQESSFGYANFPADILVQLQLIAFANLNEEDEIFILKNNYLDSFQFDIDLRGGITARLFIEPYSVRDELRKKFKQALLENQQKIGPMTISQWITDFEEMFDVRIRELTTSAEFISKHPKAIFLAPIEKIKLKELLYTYDYLLVSTLPATGQSLENIITSVSNTSGNPANFRSSLEQMAETERRMDLKTENLSIESALEKYPALNEQLITSSHIKLKAYSEPVRPSIKNWLADYTFVVGISNHDPIVRGNYLYKNENSLRLSATDREKLSAILKSFEEKTPLTVNVNTKQIIFSTPERKEFPKNPLVDLSSIDSNTEPAEINRSPKKTEVAKEPVVNLKNPNTIPEPPRKIQSQESYPQQRLAKLRQKAEPDAKRLSAWRRDLPQKESPLYADKTDGNVHFSSPQTFSTEKPTKKPKEAPSISRPSFPQLASITKTEPSTPKRPLPKNVVDLRED